MGKKLLPEKLLEIGRLLGGAKRKEKDLVQLWSDMCLANNVKTSDRVLELIAWDLQQGGVDLSQVRQTEEQKKAQEIGSQIDMARAITNLANEFTATVLQMKKQHLAEMSAIYDELKQKEMQRLQQEELKKKIGEVKQVGKIFKPGSKK